MKTKLYVLLVGVLFCVPAFPESEIDEEIESDPVVIAYESCRHSLESVLSYYINQPQSVREMVERAIHCKCRQVASAVENRVGEYNGPVDADHPAYRDLLSEGEGQVCLPPEL